MRMDELLPRSEALREAVARARGDKVNNQIMLSIDDSCEVLGGISKWTLYREMNAGKLAYKKIGRRRFIPMEAIEAYVKNLPGGGRRVA